MHFGCQRVCELQGFANTRLLITESYADEELGQHWLHPHPEHSRAMSSSSALFALAAVLTVLRLPMLDWEVSASASLVAGLLLVSLLLLGSPALIFLVSCDT